jgi:bifunctional non-homologous end joining protein LigD
VALKEYRKKRDFSQTAEPAGGGNAVRRSRAARAFVVQKHDASRLHYDFRLEHEGVLKSWAIPKGPSLNPAEKVLAVQVEDHPIEYGSFEGTIPEGQYGGGTVMLWDRGQWRAQGDVASGLQAGKLKFTLKGERLRGGWTLVRMGGRSGGDGKNWLLIKEKDEEASLSRRTDIRATELTSIKTGRTMEQIAGGQGGTRRRKVGVERSLGSNERTDTGVTRGAGADRTQTGSRARKTAAAPARLRSVRGSVRGSVRRTVGETEEVAGVRLTNPGRVLYPEQRITKLELARYYEAIADRLLVHVAGRPLTLVRCPEGSGNACFYQKHATAGMPEAVRAIDIGGGERYTTVDDAAGLVSLVQMGVLEIHPWSCTGEDLEHPDRLIFDLDPGPGVGWVDVVEGAKAVRVRLSEAGLDAFVKTSGGKGLHVVAPLDGSDSWERVKAFTKGMAQAMAADDPARYIATMSKAKRRGKIFVDYLRNARGATAVAAYSTRARAGAAVSTPLAWRDLGSRTDPSRFSIRTVLRRVARTGTDPWATFQSLHQSIAP